MTGQLTASRESREAADDNHASASTMRRPGARQGITGALSNCQTPALAKHPPRQRPLSGPSRPFHRPLAGHAAMTTSTKRTDEGSVRRQHSGFRGRSRAGCGLRLGSFLGRPSRTSGKLPACVCSRMPHIPDGRTVLTSPDGNSRPAGSGDATASAAFHTGHERDRGAQPPAAQSGQDQGSFPVRGRRPQAALPRDPQRRPGVDENPQPDDRATGVQDPLRRPPTRLTQTRLHS